MSICRSALLSAGACSHGRLQICKASASLLHVHTCCLPVITRLHTPTPGCGSSGLAADHFLLALRHQVQGRTWAGAATVSLAPSTRWEGVERAVCFTHCWGVATHHHCHPAACPGTRYERTPSLGRSYVPVLACACLTATITHCD
jgi:hypothetical protein